MTERGPVRAVISMAARYTWPDYVDGVTQVAHRRGERGGHHRHRGARRRAHRQGDDPVREPRVGPPPAGAPAPARAGRGIGRRVRFRRGAPGPRCRGTARRVRPPHVPVPPLRVRRRASPSPTKDSSSTSWWTSTGGEGIASVKNPGRPRWHSRCCARRGCCLASAWPIGPCRRGPSPRWRACSCEGAPSRRATRCASGATTPTPWSTTPSCRSRSSTPPGGGWRPASGQRARGRRGRGLRRAPRRPGCSRSACSTRPTAPPRCDSVPRSGWLVDLRGRTLEPVDGSFELRPFGIATFRSAG